MDDVDRFRDPAQLAEILGDWGTGPGPLYRKLAGSVSVAVRDGDLQVGQRLPSERELARGLHVSRATVVAAYDDLRARGIIDSRRGSGSRVAAQAVRGRSGSDGRVRHGRATSIFQRMVDGPTDVISLTYAVDSPAPAVGHALRELIDNDLEDLLSDIGYHPRGLATLREAIAGDYDDCGLPTAADQIVVTTGATQALSLIAQMYLRKGSVIIVERPGQPGCTDIFRAAGAKLIGVPLDNDGIQIEGTARALAEHKPALLFVTPTYHNPTGTLMSPARRRRLGELAAQHGVAVLEDNAYNTCLDPALAASPPPPLAASAPEAAEVLSVGSLSKSVWGGLRIGWVRAPGEIAERLARYKALADIGSPVLDQALATRLMPDLAKLRADQATILRHRFNHLTELLHESLPHWRWRTPDGGSALWIELPDTDSHVFAQLAIRHGVEVIPGTAMDHTGGHDSYIRVPYAFTMDVLTEMTRRLTRAWTELQRHGPPEPPLPPL